MIGDRRVASLFSDAAFALLACFSIASLPRYYDTPKQPTRESLDWVRARLEPGDGNRRRLPRKMGPSLLRAAAQAVRGQRIPRRRQCRGPRGAREALSGAPGVDLRDVSRALRLDFPDLESRIRRDFREVRAFPATVGDGEVSVWTRAASA